MPELDEIVVDGTKYRFVEEPKQGGFRIDRYGEPWLSSAEVRALPGIKAFIALFYTAVNLQRQVQTEAAAQLPLKRDLTRLRIGFGVYVVVSILTILWLVVA